jgi:hypothetical protein
MTRSTLEAISTAIGLDVDEWGYDPVEETWRYEDNDGASSVWTVADAVYGGGYGLTIEQGWYRQEGDADTAEDLAKLAKAFLAASAALNQSLTASGYGGGE